MEEGNIEDFEEEVDGKGLGPREVPVSRLVVHGAEYNNDNELRLKLFKEEREGFGELASFSSEDETSLLLEELFLKRSRRARLPNSGDGRSVPGAYSFSALRQNDLSTSEHQQPPNPPMWMDNTMRKRALGEGWRIISHLHA